MYHSVLILFSFCSIKIRFILSAEHGRPAAANRFHACVCLGWERNCWKQRTGKLQSAAACRSQPFPIISAKSSLLKTTKRKPQFSKRQNSFINRLEVKQKTGSKQETVMIRYRKKRTFMPQNTQNKRNMNLYSGKFTFTLRNGENG